MQENWLFSVFEKKNIFYLEFKQVEIQYYFYPTRHVIAIPKELAGEAIELSIEFNDSSIVNISDNNGDHSKEFGTSNLPPTVQHRNSETDKSKSEVLQEKYKIGLP